MNNMSKAYGNKKSGEGTPLLQGASNSYQTAVGVHPTEEEPSYEDQNEFFDYGDNHSLPWDVLGIILSFLTYPEQLKLKPVPEFYRFLDHPQYQYVSECSIKNWYDSLELHERIKVQARLRIQLLERVAKQMNDTQPNQIADKLNDQINELKTLIQYSLKIANGAPSKIPAITKITQIKNLMLMMPGFDQTQSFSLKEILENLVLLNRDAYDKLKGNVFFNKSLFDIISKDGGMIPHANQAHQRYRAACLRELSELNPLNPLNPLHDAIPPIFLNRVSEFAFFRKVFTDGSERLAEMEPSKLRAVLLFQDFIALPVLSAVVGVGCWLGLKFVWPYVNSFIQELLGVPRVDALQEYAPYEGLALGLLWYFGGMITLNAGFAWLMVRNSIYRRNVGRLNAIHGAVGFDNENIVNERVMFEDITDEDGLVLVDEEEEEVVDETATDEVIQIEKEEESSDDEEYVRDESADEAQDQDELFDVGNSQVNALGRPSTYSVRMFGASSESSSEEAESNQDVQDRRDILEGASSKSSSNSL